MYGLIIVVYLKSEPVFGVGVLQRKTYQDSKRDLVIDNNESNNELISKVNIIKRKPSQVVIQDKSNTVRNLKLVDKNYREKMFNMSGKSTQIFRNLIDMRIIPLKQKNLKKECYTRPKKYNSNWSSDMKLLVNRSLENKVQKMPEIVSPRSNMNNFDSKFLASVIEKRYYDNYKSKKATSHSNLKKFTSRNTASPQKSIFDLTSVHSQLKQEQDATDPSHHFGFSNQSMKMQSLDRKVNRSNFVLQKMKQISKFNENRNTSRIVKRSRLNEVESPNELNDLELIFGL